MRAETQRVYFWHLPLVNLTGDLNHDLRTLQAPIPSNVEITIRLKKAQDAKVLMVNVLNDDGEIDEEKKKQKYRIVIRSIELHIKRQFLNVNLQNKIDNLLQHKPLRYFYTRLQVSAMGKYFFHLCYFYHLGL